MLLSLKVGFSTIDTISFNENVCFCCDFDINESENESLREFEENEKIHLTEIKFLKFSQKNVSSEHHALVSLNYSGQYLEFSTPPPEFA